jgi:cell division protein FtsQ
MAAALPVAQLVRMRRAPGARVGALVLTAVLALGLGWLWLRDSPLVSVEQVSVRGVTGSQAPAIRDALIGAARGMTTLHVRRGDLRSAVSSFPIVRDVRVGSSFPHGLRIEVIERPPIAVLSGPGARLAVAADGRVLRGLDPPAGTPSIPMRLLPVGATVTDRRARAALALLAAAPSALRRAVRRVSLTPRRAVAVLRSGTTVYFGTPERAHAKWAAVARVLADPTSTGATYLDVRLPERPAAGVPGAQALFARAQAALQAGNGGLSSPADGSRAAIPAP